MGLNIAVFDLLIVVLNSIGKCAAAGFGVTRFGLIAVLLSILKVDSLTGIVKGCLVNLMADAVVDVVMV